MPKFRNYKDETEVTISYEEMIQALVDRRNELGISQDALAEMIGCTNSLVHKWEQFKRVPSGFMLTCWLDALGAEITISFR